MFFANEDIRTAAKKSGVQLWRVAKEKGISEASFTRLMREELKEADKVSIMEIIERIAKEERTGDK